MIRNLDVTSTRLLNLKKTMTTTDTDRQLVIDYVLANWIVRMPRHERTGALNVLNKAMIIDIEKILHLASNLNNYLTTVNGNDDLIPVDIRDYIGLDMLEAVISDSSAIGLYKELESTGIYYIPFEDNQSESVDG